MARFLPGLTTGPVRVSAYMDGYVPDGHGVVGPPRRTGGCPAGSPDNGFKLVPAIGEVAADLTATATPACPSPASTPGRYLT